MKWHKKVKEYFFLILVLGICCINFFLFLINVIPKTILYGTYESAAKPTPSISTVMSGAYQSEYQDWFSENFPFRSFFVKGYAQWMTAFKAPVNGVGFGRNNQLFEEYFTKQTISGDMDEEILKEYVSNLSMINEAISKEGKQFIYLISPSKAEVYSDDLGWNQRFAYYMDLETTVLVRKKLVSALERSGIDYLDYTLLMEKLKEDGEYQPFNSTGIHWNQYGAANAVLLLNDLINKKGTTSVGLEPYYSTENFSFFDEEDMKKLTNAYFYPKDKEYVAAALGLNGGTPEKAAFAMSTSFTHTIANLFAKGNMPFQSFYRTQYTQFQDRLYYDDNGNIIWEAWLPGQDTSLLNYSELLHSNDIILIESNAAELPESHISFAKEFSAFLGRMSSLSQYIESICKNENYLVVITSNNASELYLTSEQTEFFEKEGLKILQGNKHLFAVLDAGNVVASSLDNFGNVYEGMIDEKKYTITFSEEAGKSKVSILFDENNYWSDIGGLNFLVYDKNAKQLIDWVIFDVNSNCSIYR